MPQLLKQLKKTNYFYLSKQPAREAAPGETLVFTNIVRKGKYNVAGKPLLISFSYPVKGQLRGEPFHTNALYASTDRFGEVNFTLQVSLPPTLPTAFPLPLALQTDVFFLHSRAGHTEHVNSLSIKIVSRSLAKQLLLLFFLLLALGVGSKLLLLPTASPSLKRAAQADYGVLSPWFHWKAKTFPAWSFLTAAVFSLSVAFSFAAFPPIAFVLLGLTLFLRPPLMESIIFQALLLFLGGYFLMQYAQTDFLYLLLSKSEVQWGASLLSLLLPTPLLYLLLLFFVQQLGLPFPQHTFLAEQLGFLFLFSCFSSGLLYCLLFLRKVREGRFHPLGKLLKQP